MDSSERGQGEVHLLAEASSLLKLHGHLDSFLWGVVKARVC